MNWKMTFYPLELATSKVMAVEIFNKPSNRGGRGMGWGKGYGVVVVDTWPTANELAIPVKSSSPIISSVTNRKKGREIGFCRIPRVLELGQYAGAARFFSGTAFS